VVVLRTLEGPQRAGRAALLRGRRRQTAEEAEPSPAGWLSRVTVIDVASPLAPADAAAWLAQAGEATLAEGLAVVNRALHAYRIAAADPNLVALDRRQALAARVGFGAGEEVADGRWSAVRELPWQAPARRRRRMLAPDGRLAGLLTGREREFVCEDLALRARSDLEAGRGRHAALQVVVALDAAIAELSADPVAEALTDRLTELRGMRDAVAAAAQAALSAEPDAEHLEGVRSALGRIEAALRARAATRS
jgi:hypothetical protein